MQLAGQNETAHIPSKIATSQGEAESPSPYSQSDPETAETEYDIGGGFPEEPEEEPEMSTMRFTRYRCTVCGFRSFYEDHLFEHMAESDHVPGWMIIERGPLPGLWKRNLMSNARGNHG